MVAKPIQITVAATAATAATTLTFASRMNKALVHEARLTRRSCEIVKNFPKPKHTYAKIKCLKMYRKAFREHMKSTSTCSQRFRGNLNLHNGYTILLTLNEYYFYSR